MIQVEVVVFLEARAGVFMLFPSLPSRPYPPSYPYSQPISIPNSLHLPCIIAPKRLDVRLLMQITIPSARMTSTFVFCPIDRSPHFGILLARSRVAMTPGANWFGNLDLNWEMRYLIKYVTVALGVPDIIDRAKVLLSRKEIYVVIGVSLLQGYSVALFFGLQASESRTRPRWPCPESAPGCDMESFQTRRDAGACI